MNLRHFLASLLSLLAAPFVRRKEEPVKPGPLDHIFLIYYDKQGNEIGRERMDYGIGKYTISS